jgi:hypothetical protein
MQLPLAQPMPQPPQLVAVETVMQFPLQQMVDLPPQFVPSAAGLPTQAPIPSHVVFEQGLSAIPQSVPAGTLQVCPASLH